MPLAIVVDGLNLLRALPDNQDPDGTLVLALRGLRLYFGAPARAVFFCESEIFGRRPWLTRATNAEGFELRAVDRNVESAIIAELVELSHQHGHIVLVSGDADFAPAIHAIVGRGVRVTIVSSSQRLSRRLQPAATSVIQLGSVMTVGERPELVEIRRPDFSPEDAAFIRTLPNDQVATLRALSAGIRLEEHLRRLCTARDVQLPHNSGISQMNDALSKAGVYGKVVHRKVALWCAIRNEAAHAGEPFSTDDLRQMEAGIDAFMRQTVP